MELVKHETCQQYVASRLSEGWRVISQSGFNVVLQSPEGIIRPVDLRNDVETLRPNEAGDETNIASQYPSSDEHWDKVDEAVADEEATVVKTQATSYQRDLYKLPASSGSGDINKITVYMRGRLWSID